MLYTATTGVHAYVVYDYCIMNMSCVFKKVTLYSVNSYNCVNANSNSDMRFCAFFIRTYIYRRVDAQDIFSTRYSDSKMYKCAYFFYLDINLILAVLQ